MSIVLKNARLCDAYIWKEVEDVKVEEGKIVEIGKDLSGDEVIDLSGCTLMPGFFDAHMHLVSGSEPMDDQSLKEWAQGGVLTVRDMGFGGNQTLEEFIAWVHSLTEAETAQVVTAGRFITTDNGYGHRMAGKENGIAVKGAAEAKEAVERMKALGCHGIKSAADMERMDPDTPVLSTEEFKALADAARENGMWMGVHIQHTEYIQSLIDAGVPELAHMSLDPIPDEMLEEMVAKNMYVTPTLAVIDAPRPPLPPGELPPGMKEMMEKMMAIDTHQQEQDAVDNVRRFVKMGGKVAFGTDTMRMTENDSVQGIPIHELELMQSAGLSMQQLIEAATINSAHVCGLEESQGSIEVGKMANLIAIKGELAEDVKVFQNIDFVMHYGEVIKNLLA